MKLLLVDSSDSAVSWRGSWDKQTNFDQCVEDQKLGVSVSEPMRGRRQDNLVDACHEVIS